MPFDNKEFDSPLIFTPGKEGLRKLAYLLRQQMPAKFEWKYGVVYAESECGTAGCAMGLARFVWPEAAAAIPLLFRGTATDAATVARLFDMPLEVAEDIFFFGYACKSRRHSEIKPVAVADAIDKYLASP